MISTDFTIELSNWALSLERTRATIASENIANANLTGVKKTVNFEAMISSVSQALEAGNVDAARNILDRELDIETTSSNSLFGGVSLDSEVADLSASKGRYKVIADALSRKFGLMTLAARGQ